MKYKQFSLKSKSTYLHEIHPLTGDNLWIVQDLDLKETKQVKNLIQKFIALYNQPDFNLSIFDTLTNDTIQINANLQDIPGLVDYIYKRKRRPNQFYRGKLTHKFLYCWYGTRIF